jgi:hypothetical protein
MTASEEHTVASVLSVLRPTWFWKKVRPEHFSWRATTIKVVLPAVIVTVLASVLHILLFGPFRNSSITVSILLAAVAGIVAFCFISLTALWTQLITRWAGARPVFSVCYAFVAFASLPAFVAYVIPPFLRWNLLLSNILYLFLWLLTVIYFYAGIGAVLKIEKAAIIKILLILALVLLAQVTIAVLRLLEGELLYLL